MFKVRLVQIFVCDLNVSIFFILVASGDLLPRNLRAFGITESFV